MYPGRESRPCLLSDLELHWPLRFLLPGGAWQMALVTLATSRRTWCHLVSSAAPSQQSTRRSA